MPPKVVKFKYTIQITSVVNVFPFEHKNVYVVWKRGAKKDNQGKTKVVTVQSNQASFRANVRMECSMVPNTHAKGKGNGITYKPKLMKVYLREGNKVLGSGVLDLAEYTVREADPTEVVLPFQYKSKPRSTYDSLLASHPTQWRLLLDPICLTRPASDGASPSSATDAMGSAYSADDDYDSLSGMHLGSGGFDSAEMPSETGQDFTVADDDDDLKTCEETGEFERDDSAIVRTNRSTRRRSRSDAKEVKRLRLENKRLHEQLLKVEEKRKDLSNRWIAVKTENKLLRKGLSKSELKELKVTMKETSKEIASSCVNEAVVSDELMRIIRTTVEREDALARSVYWFGCCVNLHVTLSIEVGTATIMSQTGVNTRPVVAEARTPMPLFINDLEALALYSYKRMLSLVKTSIHSEVDRIITTLTEVPAMADVGHERAGRVVASCLETMLSHWRACQLPRAVLNQSMFQAVFYVNVITFNGLMRRAATAFTFGTALTLKIIVSELEAMLSKHVDILYAWSTFRPLLQRLVDFANLLMLEKSHLSADVVTSACPALTMKQIKYILDGYNVATAAAGGGGGGDGAQLLPQAVELELCQAAGLEDFARVPMDQVTCREETLFNLSDTFDRPNQ